ncbi:N-acetylneuraminate epimerase [Devosia sp. A369]
MTALRTLTCALVLTTAFGGTQAMAQQWPDLPVGIKSGVSAQIGDTILVGLGSAGQALYGLDLNNIAAGWTERADFIGSPTSGAASVATGGKLYIFGGNGKATPDAISPIIYDTAYVYDPAADSWSKLDTVTPAGLSGARAMATSDGRIVVAGGYNKTLFDAYLHDVATTDSKAEPEKYAALVQGYMAQPPEFYQWNDTLLSYDPASNSWGELGENPFLPNCDAAFVDLGNDRFLLLNGEIKPGLRTDEVKTITLANGAATWEAQASLPAPSSAAVQEGVAGAYAGKIGDVVLLTGGANFPGARDNSQAGKWFAHEGLTKTWRDEVYALVDGAWSQVGALPEAMGYGASFSLPEGVLLVGGEDGTGAPRADVRLMRWDGASVGFDE